MTKQTKLFAGPKLRSVREHVGMTQASFARQLGISGAYLNQIESNQRPLTAAVLVGLSRQFGVEIAAFSGDDEGRLAADLAEMLRDPIFVDHKHSAWDIKSAVTTAPWLVQSALELHRFYRTHVDRMQALEFALDSNAASRQFLSPYEEVRDFFLYTNGYLSSLDDSGEALASAIGAMEGRPLRGLIDYLSEKHSITVSKDDGPHRFKEWIYERSKDTIRLDVGMEEASCAFALASQIAIIEHNDLIDEIISNAGFESRDSEELCRIALANYFAGSVLLPYSTFQPLAKELRHDVCQLSYRFGATVEQVMHRLSTMQRPGARGVPIYFAKLDVAGNIIKRHSANRFRFGRFTGTCPLWNVHEALRLPDRYHVQVAEMTDSTRFLCVSRAMIKPSRKFGGVPRIHVLSMGCELQDAREFVYADTIDLRTTPVAQIGISCRVCEREDCEHRAMPPIDKGVVVAFNRRGTVPYTIADTRKK